MGTCIMLKMVLWSQLQSPAIRNIVYVLVLQCNSRTEKEKHYVCGNFWTNIKILAELASLRISVFALSLRSG